MAGSGLLLLLYPYSKLLS